MYLLIHILKNRESHFMKNQQKVVLSGVVALILSACGGGGISSSADKERDDAEHQYSSVSFDLDDAIKQARNEGNEIGYLSSEDYPIFEFKDKHPIVVLTRNQNFVDTGLEVIDREGNDLSDKVQISGTVDTGKPGKYTVDYILQDTYGSRFGLKRYVFVVENTPPMIKLKGSSNIETFIGKGFDDPGYTVYDREDRDAIYSKVTITGDLDLTKPGEYKITYTVIDSAGETADVTRYIAVNKVDDIKSEIIEVSTKPDDYQYNLWDYMVNTTDNNISVLKFDQDRYTSKILRTISNDIGKKIIHVSYTDKILSYTNLYDNIKIEIENNTTSDSVYLKNRIKPGDTITTDFQENTNNCILKEHYDKIKLANILYQDVIKIECNEIAEAYFQKNRGIVLENILTANDTLDTFGLKEFSYTPPEIKIIDFKPEPDSGSPALGEDNYEGEKLTKTDKIQTEPYNLSGKNLTVGVVDGGNVLDTHIELSGRVKNLEEADISSHSTHVAGTIGATGINILAKGYAYQTHIEAISFNTYSGADSLIYFADKNIFITNHSYGSALKFGGVYHYHAYKADEAVTKNPNIIAVAAAGNERNDGYGDYWLIDSFNNAKNIITVGALGDDLTLSYFSSTGPTSLGRLKPDVVTRGENVKSLSSYSDNKSYTTKQGTSMATPAITGIITLLQEEYIKVNNEKMREDIAKGLLIQSATDLGRFGPDYEYGFGLPDALKAVKIIDSMKTSSPLLQDREINKTDFHQYNLKIDNISEFVRLTLSWIDPTTPIEWGKKNPYTPELNTDLDITIVDSFGNIVYAYTLDGDNPEEDAKEDKNNRVDNVEQIETRLNKGDYTVFIRVHKMVNSQTQKYSLFSNIPLKNFKVRNSANIPLNEFETKILKE